MWRCLGVDRPTVLQPAHRALLAGLTRLLPASDKEDSSSSPIPVAALGIETECADAGDAGDAGPSRTAGRAPSVGSDTVALIVRLARENTTAATTLMCQWYGYHLRQGLDPLTRVHERMALVGYPQAFFGYASDRT